MVGFQCCLAFLAPPLGQLVRLRVLITFVEAALGCYSSGMVAEWSSPCEFDRVEAASLIPDRPNVWSDGSLVLDQVTGVSSSGAGFLLTSLIATGEIGGGVMLIMFALKVLFCPVEVSALFLGLFSRHHGSVPFELVKGGFIFEGLTRFGSPRLRVMQMRAWFSMVELGRLTLVVGELVGNAVIAARRNLSGVCGRWYSVLLVLIDFSRKFFIAIFRAVVNHDGRDGTAPDPLVWSVGALPWRRRLVHAVRDRFSLPGPPGVWDSEWVNIPASAVCAEDIAHWPYTPGLLVKWVSFLGSLHWPVGGLDLGVGGVS